MNWLLVIAIFAAVFPKQIDEAVKGNGLVCKVAFVFSLGVILVMLIPICMRYL